MPPSLDSTLRRVIPGSYSTPYLSARFLYLLVRERFTLPFFLHFFEQYLANAYLLWNTSPQIGQTLSFAYSAASCASIARLRFSSACSRSIRRQLKQTRLSRFFLNKSLGVDSLTSPHLRHLTVTFSCLDLYPPTYSYMLVRLSPASRSINSFSRSSSDFGGGGVTLILRSGLWFAFLFAGE